MSKNVNVCSIENRPVYDVPVTYFIRTRRAEMKRDSSRFYYRAFRTTVVCTMMLYNIINNIAPYDLSLAGAAAADSTSPLLPVSVPAQTPNPVSVLLRCSHSDRISVC